MFQWTIKLFVPPLKHTETNKKLKISANIFNTASSTFCHLDFDIDARQRMYLWSVLGVLSIIFLIQKCFIIRVSHITPFFELSLVLLTTQALRLYEFTKKFQRYRPKIEVWGKIFVFALFTFAKSAHFRTKKNGTSSGQIKILRPLL